MSCLRTDQVDYWRRDMPTSAGRFLLIRALERLCAARVLSV
jgi:hypothetical protein